MSGPAADVLIAGGGMVGASLALALRDYPGRVLLVDERAPPAPAGGLDARSTALADGSRRIFEALGLWPALAARAAPIRRIHVSDRGHFGAARLSCDEQGVDALGYVIENHDLQEVLDAALAGCARIERLRGTVRDAALAGGEVRVVVPHPRGVRRLAPRLLVVAAGARSPLASELGFNARERRYGQSAVVANVTPSNPQADLAFERFTASGPLAVLPLTGGRCAVVMTVPDDEVDAVLALDDRGFLARLQSGFGSRLGVFTRVGRRAAFPLALSQVTRQVGERVALVGNAARALHPVAGQGFNLALRDVADLAETLLGAEGRQDPGAPRLLQAFAARRRGDQRRTVLLTDLLVGLFSNRFAPLVLARGAGLLALDLVPPLRHWFARQTMGRNARLPYLGAGLLP